MVGGPELRKRPWREPAGRHRTTANTQFERADDGYTVGVQGGYNWQLIRDWVTGIEGDINWLGIDRTRQDW